MKKIQLLVVIGLLGSFSSYGQKDPSDMDPALLEAVMATSVQTDKKMVEPAARNQVYLNQVGNRNFSNSTISATESNLNLTQQGDSNYMNLYARVNTIYGSVHQDGNYNKFFNMMDEPSEDALLNITQNGNHGHFAQFGTNSIGNSLQFEMNGDFKSVTVRNFK